MRSHEVRWGHMRSGEVTWGQMRSQYSTIQYSALQYITVQYSTVQYCKYVRIPSTGSIGVWLGSSVGFMRCSLISRGSLLNCLMHFHLKIRILLQLFKTGINLNYFWLWHLHWILSAVFQTGGTDRSRSHSDSRQEEQQEVYLNCSSSVETSWSHLTPDISVTPITPKASPHHSEHLHNALIISAQSNCYIIINASENLFLIYISKLWYNLRYIVDIWL